MAILVLSSVSPQADSACTGPLSASFQSPGAPITRTRRIRRRTPCPQKQEKDGESTAEGDALPPNQSYDVLPPPPSVPTRTGAKYQ